MNRREPFVDPDVMPRCELPAETQAWIARVVLLPNPPDRWHYLGLPDDLNPTAVIPSRAWYEWHWHRGVNPKKFRQALPGAVRDSVIARDGLTCGLCGSSVELADVHIDHVLPVSRGGSDHPQNLQVSHSRCNLSKGARAEA